MWPARARGLLAFVACTVAVAAAGWADVEAQASASGVKNPAPRALPFELQAGDVLANRPLGVLRESEGTVVRSAWSAMLGVTREAAPEAPIERLLGSPAVGVHRGAGISSVDPDRLAVDSNGQPLTINGFGLGSVTSARIVPADNITVSALEIAASGESVSFEVDIGPEGQPGLRRVELVDDQGRVVPRIVEGADQVLVTAPQPVIHSIEPVLVSRDSATELVIRGKNLRGLPFQTRNLGDQQPDVLITPADGIRIGEDVLSNNEGTLVRVSIALASDAPLGDRLIQVETRSARSSDVMSAANTLRVVDGSTRSFSPITSAPVGVTRQVATMRTQPVFSFPVGVSRGPVVLDITPEAMLRGESGRLSISGAELEAVSSVSIEPPDGVAIDESSLTVSGEAVAVDLSVDGEAPLFKRRIRLQTPNAVLVAPKLLEIQDAPPELHALTPTFLVRDGVARTIAIQGDKLSQSRGAAVLPPDDIVVQDYEVTGDDSASLTLLADPAAEIGPRVVQILGINDNSSSQPSPANTLEIVEVAQIFSPVASSPLGVTRESEGASDARELFSSPVGVTRGAYADSLVPAAVSRGTTTTMTVEGRGLDAVSDVIVESLDGVVVDAVNSGDAGSILEFDLTVAADAAPGFRRVILVTSSGRVSFVPVRTGIFGIDENDVQAPETVPDDYIVAANRSFLVGAAEGLLANDSSDQGELFAVLRTLPANGSLNLESDGGFAYTPDPDFVGVDQFQYSAGSDQAIGNAATVSLSVEERNDAVTDSYVVADDDSLLVAPSNGLLANDRIVPGDTPSILLESEPALGSLALQQDGSFQYVPDGVSGVDSFSYRLEVAEGTSLPAEVSIEVVPVNDPPDAADDGYVVTVGEQLRVSASEGVLRNDTDPDGDPLAVRLVSNPSEGALSLAADGSFVYTPPEGFVGTVQFTYEASDDQGLSDTATVSITVNNALAPQADFYQLAEGEILAVPPEEGVLVNDSVISQGEARVILDQGASEGVVELLEDGSFVYEPESSDYSGTDQFSYYLEDDAVVSNPATVTLTINPVNDPPVAADDVFLTDENAELVVDAPGVIENDSDPDSTELFAELSSDADHGAVTVDPEGGFTYVPDVNFRGEDSFVYSLEDPEGASSTGIVTIKVTQPPTATNDVYFVETDAVIEIQDPEKGLLINDHDAPENDELSALLSEPPDFGVVVLNADGTFSYAPDPGFQGIDTMTYRVTDGISESNVATVTFPVGITSFPRAVADHYVLQEEETFFVPAEEGLLVNDTDADTPLEQLEASLVGTAYQGRTPLDVTVNDDGSFTVTPWADFFGETFFVYQVFDGTDISNSAIVTLEVLPVNDGIQAEDDEFGVETNQVFVSKSRGSGSIGFNDQYDDDYVVEWEIVSMPSHGDLELEKETSVFRYTPDPDFAGSDQFTYRAYQVETGISDTAVVTMFTNAPPVANDDYLEFDEDTVPVMLPPPIANDTDANGDTLRYWRDGFYDRQVSVHMSGLEADAEVTLHPTSDFYGPNTSSYVITDGSVWVRGEIEMVVHPVPDRPRTRDDEYLVQRNDRLVINDPGAGVLGNDYDPDKRQGPGHPVWPAATGVDLEPLTAELIDDVSQGSLTFYDSGLFIYEPTPDFSGFDSFTYRAVDATGRVSEVETVQIRVNSPAVAGDDAYAVNEDRVLEQGVEGGLLANDSDPDGDELRASRHYSGCAPCNGSVVIHRDGGFRYVPDPDFHGQDEFFYRVRDGVKGYDVGRVVVTVLPVNDAPITEADTYRTREDVVLTAPEPQGTLRNDREVDGDDLTDAELVAPASDGSVAFQPDGSFTYTPDVDFNGRDTFTYRVYDTTGLASGEEVVEVFVTPVNDAPSAGSDQYETDQDGLLTVDAENGVMVNDSDVDGPAPVVVLISPPLHGEVSLEADGGFVYEPDGVFTGTDRFTYQLDDGLGAVDSAIVSIVVNAGDPEVDVTAEADFYQFEGPSIDVSEPGLLSNDTLEGEGTLAAALVLSPEHGTVTLEPDGRFSYQAPPGFVGIDGFTYSASARGVSDLARVTLDVLPTGNVPPVANDDSYSLLEDQMLDSRQIGSLLDNDQDYEGEPLLMELLSQPNSGQLELSGDGHFEYVPERDFHGSVSFRYRVSDGQDVSGEATVTIAVIARNDAPEAVDDAYQTEMDETLDMAASDGLLSNDVDVDGDELTVSVVDSPDHGQVDVQPDGAFVYTPLPGFTGNDVFRYVASDSGAQSAASVYISVNGEENRPPSASGEIFVVAEDTPLDSATAGSVLDNDSDPDGDALVAILDSEPEHGDLQFAGGEFTYRPDADYFGPDAFTYHVSDGEYSEGPVTARIEITPVNDAPVTRTDLYDTPQDQAIVIAAGRGVLANDSDPDDDVLVATLETAAARGELTLNEDGSFEYVPEAGFAGRDEFAYRVSDGEVERSGRAIVDVTEAANQRPVATGEVYELPEDTILDTRSLHGLLANDVDPDGSSLTLVPETLPSVGEAELLDEGHLRYTPARDAVGDFELVYRVSDGELASHAVSAVIRLLPRNDPPQAQSDVYAIAPDATSLTVAAARGVLSNDVDVDGDSLIARIESQPESGQLEFGLDGSFTYTPHGEPKRDSFTYTVVDPSGEESLATVNLIVSAGDDTDVIFLDGFEEVQP